MFVATVSEDIFNKIQDKLDSEERKILWLMDENDETIVRFKQNLKKSWN